MMHAVKIVAPIVALFYTFFWLMYSSGYIVFYQFMIFSYTDLAIKTYIKKYSKQIQRCESLKWLYFYYKIFSVLQSIYATRINMNLEEEKIVVNVLCLILFNKLFNVSNDIRVDTIFETDIELILLIAHHLYLLPLSENNRLVVKSGCLTIGILTTIDSFSILREKKKFLTAFKYCYLVYKVVFRNNLLETHYHFVSHINSSLLEKCFLEDNFILFTMFALDFTSDKGYFVVFIAYEIYKSFVRFSK